MVLLNEDEMFDLFNEKDFSKVENFIKNYGIEAVDRDGRNLLVNFIIERDKKNALKIIQTYNGKGLDINQADSEGWTPLHFAVQEGIFPIIEALVNAGVVINKQEVYGRTPLFIAVFNRLPSKIIKYLIENGADINIPNTEGISARQFLSKELTKWIDNYK